MLVVHGLWLPAGHLGLWAEDSTPPPRATRRAARPHPFAAPAEVVAAALGDLAAKGSHGSATLRLPTAGGRPLDSPELVRTEAPARSRAAVALAPWRVPTLELDPDAAVTLLRGLDDGVAHGASLRHAAEVAAFAADLVRRGRLLPAVAGDAAAWRPLLTGGDAAWARALAAALPPSARAGGGDPAALVGGMLDAMVDAAARAALEGVRLAGGRGTTSGSWLGALTGRDRRVDADASELATLAEAVAQWQRDAAGGAVRACFRLVEPGEEETRDWRVDFALQAADEPSLVVDAEEVWRSRGALDALARHLDAPQETLLTELGRASRLWTELDDALRTAKPSTLDLDVTGAHRFLREGAPLLHAAGFGVLLPTWWGRPGSRLGAKLRAKSRTAPGTVASASAVGMRSLVDYQWELALGDEPLSEKELRELAKLKTPLVRLRGRWVELDAKHLAAGLKLLKSGGEMSVGELLHLGLSMEDDPDALPIQAVTADGALGDLLAGEAERHLEPIDPPESFAGTLRPYQRRGLAWLTFLQSLGLGGILADDMGLGKCLSGDMSVFVNGKLVTAERLWAEYAGPSMSDGEGEWAAPTRPLMVNALSGGPFPGPMVEAPVRRLYRQHVSEWLRRIRLDDGSEVLITRRHKLLGTHGWTNAIKVGDRLCVPARLTWRGEPVDPDLTTLLAWQISEGHELPTGALRISQRDTTVLDRVRRSALDVGARLGVRVNRPTITVNDKGCGILDIRSVAYMRYLEERGYRWGQRSAGKAIPDFVVAADDATIALFLREFFTAEGSVVPAMRMVEISSASPVIMRQLATMLRRFGIWLRFSVKHKRATNGSGILRPYHVGVIGGPSLRLFQEHIGFSDPMKTAKLAKVCAKPANTNVEGVPAGDILSYAKSVTGLPARHFGVGTVYFAGGQETSRASAALAVAGMDRILSGEAAAEYAARPRTRWTAAVTEAYRRLDVDGLGDLRDALAWRAGSEVRFAEVVEVEDVHHTGWVYDFEVAMHHNFVAGGMLCHNTVQLLALISGDGPQVGPTLLVCPMSLVGNWEREAAKFAPGLRVHVHHGAERARGAEFAAAVRAADIVVTTYSVAARDAEALGEIPWHRVVVDEAQAIKNAATRQAAAVRALPARHRVAVTGTPVENRLADLWSIMDFANPGLLGGAAAFKKKYALPVERHGDEEAAARLRRITGPFVLRRLKTDKTIISDLPEKLEMEVLCNLTGEQASLYQAVVDDMLERIERSDGIERRGLVLATMSKLKQVCNHPAQFLHDDTRLAGRSGKLARLEEILDEVLAAGEKALLFSQYAEFGGMLRAHLSARHGREVLFLHGGVSKKDRDAMVARFQGDGGPPLFVLSLKAGGTGLTLTAANHVVHVDRWWNPAVEDQATDRAFRIGQRRAVQVRKFVCAGTVEEKVAEMIREKRGLAARIVGTGEQWLTELSTTELRQLFALEAGAVVE
ncbi:SNF2-related protein [Phytohabitans kaempferiae]|uniref:SNF2-related protein n=1 Tax=Phytohabitans kaempferiae TaxID=1620943 RepID=A0ABV6MD93_9ACTN